CRVWMSAPFWAPAYLPVLAIALRRIGEMASAPSSPEA
ncbi:polyketide cyclase, partial [Mycobacterium sp. ITM-2017-0098]